MMTELSYNLEQALLLLGQGMAGIFAVLGIIALAVAIMQRIDQNSKK